MAKLGSLHLSVVVLLFMTAPASKTSGFLTSRQALRRASEERLRDNASRLAFALGDHLRYRPMLELTAPRLPLLAEDARSILRREASRPDAWDGANLLNDYAAWAPDYVLVAPFADGGKGAAPMTNDAVQQIGPIGHAVSQETVVQSDGDHTFSQTTSCKDGDCKTTKSNRPGGNLQSIRSVQRYHAPGLSSFHNAMQQTMEPLHKAMKQMSQEMKNFDDHFGRDPLKESLGSIFGEAHGASKTAGTLDSSDSWGNWFRSPASKGMNSIFKTASSQASNSQSMSSETNIENGKRVTRQKICENGHCKLVVTTEDS